MHVYRPSNGAMHFNRRLVAEFKVAGNFHGIQAITMLRVPGQMQCPGVWSPADRPVSTAQTMSLPTTRDIEFTVIVSFPSSS